MNMTMQSNGHRGLFTLDVHFPLVIAVLTLCLAGVVLLYSVAVGDFSPWAWRHATRLLAGLFLMLFIAALDIRTIFAVSYLIFGIILILLLGVELFGVRSMGATRWLDLALVRVQP